MKIPRDVWLVSLLVMPLLWTRTFGPNSHAGFASNWEQMGVARALVAGQGFANPFVFSTGPTAHVAPVHPWLLAAILWLFGDGPATAIPAALLEIAIQTTALLLLLRISVLLFETWIPGALAAGVMLAVTYPLPQWDSSLAWLAIELVILGFLTGMGHVGVGLLMGLAWLISPALAPMSVVTAVALRGWRSAAWFTVVASLAVTPWLAHTASVFGVQFFIRDNFGLELYISNHDLAGPRFQDGPERFTQLHPAGNPEAAAELVRMGEPIYFAHLQTRAIDWIRAHPERFLQLTAARVGLWWGSTGLLLVVSVAGWIGAWLLRRRPIGQAAVGAMLIFPLPYYAVQYDPRYSWSVLWLVALLAGYAVWQISARWGDREGHSREEKSEDKSMIPITPKSILRVPE